VRVNVRVIVREQLISTKVTGLVVMAATRRDGYRLQGLGSLEGPTDKQNGTNWIASLSWR
jgi:hypothetical protein